MVVQQYPMWGAKPFNWTSIMLENNVRTLRLPRALVSSKQNDIHRRPKLKITDKRRERDSSVSAYKVVLCYNGLNYKGLYGKTMDLF